MMKVCIYLVLVAALGSSTAMTIAPNKDAIIQAILSNPNFLQYVKLLIANMEAQSPNVIPNNPVTDPMAPQATVNQQPQVPTQQQQTPTQQQQTPTQQQTPNQQQQVPTQQQQVPTQQQQVPTQQQQVPNQQQQVPNQTPTQQGQMTPMDQSGMMGQAGQLPAVNQQQFPGMGQLPPVNDPGMGQMPPVDLSGMGQMPPVDLSGMGQMPPVDLSRMGQMPPVDLSGMGQMPPVDLTGMGQLPPPANAPVPGMGQMPPANAPVPAQTGPAAGGMDALLAAAILLNRPRYVDGQYIAPVGTFPGGFIVPRSVDGTDAAVQSPGYMLNGVFVPPKRYDIDSGKLCTGKSIFRVCHVV